jgi:aerotaxis receptor
METSFDIFMETEVPEGEVIISRTNLRGVITYVNETFATISGYSPAELIGHAHNILRHPDMPKSVFKELWDTISAGNTWEGYVKNRRKDGGYYWVYASISGVYRGGELVEYKSLRSYVDPEKRREMQALYDAKRLEEGDSVRTVMYLQADLYKQLLDEAEDAGITLDTLFAERLSR